MVGRMDVITCENLTKRFGPAMAVSGLDLAVSPGQVYGFLGPNGAGKTTTIRMLLGLITPLRARSICSASVSPPRGPWPRPAR